MGVVSFFGFIELITERTAVPEALLNSAWNHEMLTGFPTAYFQIKTFFGN